MSLITIAENLEAKAREDIQDAVAWTEEMVQRHLPAAVAELKKIAANPVTKAIEDAVLTPAEEAWIARVIAGLPELRGQASG